MAEPKLDKRTKRAIEDDAVALAALPAYELNEWIGAVDPANPDPGRDLIGLFARMMELLIERLNRVPRKNFLEFLDLVGVEPSPGNAAAVPVTFVLSKKEEVGGEILAGTRVATTQTETADAQVFETRSDFYATPAKLVAMINVVPEAEAYSRLPLPEVPPKPEALAPEPMAPMMLSGDETSLLAVEHVLYLAQADLFARGEPVDVTLVFTLSGNQTDVFDAAHLEWRIYSADAEDWVGVPTPPIYSIGTNIVSVTFPGFQGAAATTVGGVEAVWLACHFVSAADTSLDLPTIVVLNGSFAPPAVGGVPSTERTAPMQHALSNTLPLDFTKPVFPFGQRPKYGDALYLGHDLAFGPDVESITLNLTIRNYTDAELANAFTGANANDEIVSEIEWQYWAADGQWVALPGTTTFRHEIDVTATGTSTGTPTVTRPDASGLNECLWGTDASGSVTMSFNLDPGIGLQKLGDTESYWLRAVVRSNDPYGREGFLARWPGPPDEFAFVGPPLFPPIIESAAITYRYRAISLGMRQVQTLNGFELRSHDPVLAAPGLAPFVRLPDRTLGITTVFGADTALYLAFDRDFDNVFVSLFVHIDEVFSADQPQLEAGEPQTVWEYLAEGQAWKPLDVTDGTNNLTGSGLVSFQAPIDAIKASLFPDSDIAAATGPEACWYRIRLDGGRYDYPPRLRFVLLNSVLADNRTTFDEVVVGSGNGQLSQQLAVVQTPVLDAELWVREPERPSEDDMLLLEQDLADEHRESGAPGDPPAAIEDCDISADGESIWVRWLRRPNFLASDPNSRHYTLETSTGFLSFGDGTLGLIPPIARDNIVLRNLERGGGEAANTAATPLAVKELKTSLPFVDKVFNTRGATGGSNPWTRQQIFDLGPQFIKNKGRAVTTEDYEWLVRAEFSQTARVRCLATRRPASSGGLEFAPGAVTLIIVPTGKERTPQPPKSLLEQIVDYLRRNVLGNLFDEVHAIAPTYAPVRIAATLVPERPQESSRVRRRAVRALEDFLHPLTGGEDGDGWPFGRAVFRSEVFSILQSVDGVDHVVTADFIDFTGANSVAVGENELAASGDHEIGVI